MARAATPIWLTRASRFAGMNRAVARGVLALFAVLIALSLTAVDAPDALPADSGEAVSDILLYQRIVQGVQAGGDYYTVAGDAQRASGYPLRPVSAMRLPTLAVVQAALPELVTTALLYALAAATLAAWWRRLGDMLNNRAPRIVAAALLACGAMVSLRYDLQAFHELWAGLLIALSLALWRTNRWVEPVAIALCAMAIRETAALYAVVMLGCAVFSGRRREVMGWSAALGIFALLIVLHSHAWSRVVMPEDSAGPGWGALLGPGFLAKTIADETALAALPMVLAAPLVALALAGWAALDSPFAARAGLSLAAYAGLIAMFCRPDTPYWGLMIAPISLVGLAFIPDALRDLMRAALDNRRIIVTRRVE